MLVKKIYFQQVGPQRKCSPMQHNGKTIVPTLSGLALIIPVYLSVHCMHKVSGKLFS